MPRVTDEIVGRVERQVEAHRFVIWLDPERHYAKAVEVLSARGVRAEAYQGSFFALRRRVEDALDGTEPPRLVVYLPLDMAQARGPMCEVMAAGVLMYPGQQPPTRNTRLAVIARAALTGVLGDAAMGPVLKQAEDGRLSLEDLDAISDRRDADAGGALGLVFGASSGQEVVLLFAGSEGRDTQLVERGAVAELLALLEREVSLKVKPDLEPAQIRRALFRHLASTELAATLKEKAGVVWRALPPAAKGSGATRALDLIGAWRNRRDLAETYVRLAADTETELSTNELDLPMDALEGAETFRCLDGALQTMVAASLLLAPTARSRELARTRRRGFWASAPEVMERWTLIETLAELLEVADDVQRECGRCDGNVQRLAEAYVGKGEDMPWALLDTLHRQSEKRYHDLTLEGAPGDSLERLMARCRSRYTDTVGHLADMFLGALEASHFRICGIPRQTETFERFVAPGLSSGSTAYVLVDGLRFEMARELHRSLSADGEAQLAVTQGVLPSITEIGMAALMPGASDGAELISKGGKLGLLIRGRALTNRQERIDYLVSAAGVPACAFRLDQLLHGGREVKEAATKARLLLITSSDEVDGLGEKHNIGMARRFMDDVFRRLRAMVRMLFELGTTRVIITSDHGFLFGESLHAGATIEPPGGKTADLHRRVWVGQGGAASSSYLRVAVKETGLKGEFDLALPRSFAGFSGSGGSKAYFHGGASPQEMLVPVLTVLPRLKKKRSALPVEWSLSPGSHTLSTRFLSVQVAGRVTSIPPSIAVRVEIREGADLLAHNLTEALDKHFSLGSHLNARDVKAVRKTVSGFLKLLHPHGEYSRDELAEIMDLAIEGRRRVKEQLKKMGAFEYHQTSFSYIDRESMEERFVGVPEEGGRDLIATDPLAPGSVYTACVSDQGRVGLYRLEVGVGPGSGRLRVAGGVEGIMKESLTRAFAYLLGHKEELGIGQLVVTSDFHVEAVDLLSNHTPCEAGVALFIAVYSALHRRAVLPALLILGDMSIQGNLKRLRSLVEPIRLAMENGARRVLIPVENRREFLEIPTDVLDKVDPIFYADPLTAALKGLGLK